MRLDKIKNTFNDYKLEVSWGQLEAIRNALERDHSEPISDEMLAEFDWYMDRVPGPGEEEEDVKTREEMGGVPGGEAAEGEGLPGVEMPPTEGGAVETGGGPPAPPEEMPGGEQPTEGGEPEMAEGPLEAPPEAEGAPGMEGPPGEGAPTEEPPPEEADRHLAAPPTE